MNIVFKNKWVAALESGQYKQAKKILYDGFDGYCCLGIACIIKGAEFTSYEDSDGEIYDNRPVFESTNLAENNDEKLNEAFLQEIGMTNAQQMELAWMNDNGKSFKEIAKFIKTNPNF